MVSIRIRSMVWFVTGAVLAVAITLMFVSAWRVDAAPGDSDTTFVPITPCRLADTRPAPNRVGTQGTFAPDDTKTFAAHGTNGECTLPAEAEGLSLNVTAVNMTAPLTFLTIWPAGEARPLASSLNPAAGQPPTPNAVATSLSAGGEFSVYNLAGAVDVIVDVNGYYTAASLAELHNRLTAVEASRSFAVTATAPGLVLTGATQVVASVEVTAPVAGHVTVSSRTLAQHDGPEGSDVACGIEPSGTLTNWLATSEEVQWFERDDGAANKGSLAGTRTFEVDAESTNTLDLTCREIVDGGQVRHTTLTAIFTPAP